MSNTKIHLKEYDMVVAVTQQAINQTMSDYLYKLEKDVALYYTADDKGNLVPAKEEADAAYIFKGRLDYTLDAEGHPVDMVKLHVPGECQKVNYNVTFKNAEFSSKYPPKFKIEQSECPDPWIIGFQVSLALQDTVLDKLPEGIRKKVEEYVKNLGPDMFSIHQLCVDLNTAVFDKFQNVTGMTQVSEVLFIAIMKDYVQRQQEQGSILFGYGIKHSGKNNALPPTFMPTSLNFCVTPYQDSKGGTNPNLDTLNYLVMTDNHAPPRDIPTSFDFNWVEDSSEHGSIAIKRDLFLQLLLNKLNPVLKTLRPEIKVQANSGTIEITPGTDSTFQLEKTATEGTISRQTYSKSAADNYSTPWYYFFWGGYYEKTASANYDMTCSITLKEKKILHIEGKIVAKAENATRTPAVGQQSLHDISTMPNTTFLWSVDLELRTNLEKNGQLDIVIKNPDFNKTPVVESHEESWWEKLLSSLPSCVTKTYAENLGNFRTKINSEITNTVENVLIHSLSSANAFVFPGGNTFVFKQPMFSESQELISTITYRSPTGKGELK